MNIITHAPQSLPRMNGFGLIEILVGMVVALLATLVINQMYANFEGQKRTSTSGADAQENGMIALYTVERDARMAGAGMTSDALLNCTAVYSAYDNGAGSVTTPAPGFSATGFAPVSITDGGGGPDTITFTFGSSLRAGIPAKITQAMPSTANDIKVDNFIGFTAGQKVIVTDGSQCTVRQITNVQTGNNAGLVTNSGVNAPYNPSGNITNSWPSYPIGSNVFSVDNFIIRQYSIGTSSATRALRLQEMSVPGSTPQDIVGDIVEMQAQYGVAPTGSQQVNCWVNATNGGNACDSSNWAAPSATNIKRIKAIRIAVLSRSAISEKPNLSGTCSTTTTAPTSWTGGPAFTLTGTWQCYRYKVFQTVVPLRNVVWANI